MSASRTKSLSLPKKLVFSSIVLLLFFSTFEIILRLAGVQPAVLSHDPYLGFSGSSPLFHMRGNRYSTTPSKLAWFNQQSFSRTKQRNEKRIFCVGGSTTYGRPYDDSVSFSGWLRLYLNACDADQNWTVVNCGGISYASYRVVRIVEEILTYAPDIVVIYTGHNEFLEQRTYPEQMQDVTAAPLAVLEHFRTIGLLRSWLTPAQSVPGITELPEDVSAILDHSVGPGAYHRDPQFADQVVQHFHANLKRMIAICQSAGVKVVCIQPAANLKDCSPFKSEFSSVIGLDRQSQVTELIDSARSDIKKRQWDSAIGRLQQAIEVDGNYAISHFLLAEAYFGQEKFEQAELEFEVARELDVCPLRANAAILDVIESTSAQMKIPLIRFDQFVRQQSTSGIPGKELFWDHVHPKIELHRQLSELLIEEFERRGWSALKSDWKELIPQLTDKKLATIDTAQHAIALKNLSKVLAWAGKYDEADQLALQTVKLAPNDAEAHYQAGAAALRAGDLERATNAFETSIKKDPNYSMGYYGLGLVHEERGLFAAALEDYRTAARLSPDQAPIQFNFGRLLHMSGDLKTALLHLSKAAALNQRSFKAQFELGIVYAKLQQFPAAQKHMSRAVELDPNHPDALFSLGQIFELQNQKAEAEKYFRKTVSVSPNHELARQGIARLRGDQ